MLRRTALALGLAVIVAGCGDAGKCAGGARAELALSRAGGAIEAAFAVEGADPGASWRLVVVHEGHVSWRGHARTTRRGGLYLHRRFDDYSGVDHVSVRAIGPNGATCTATATLEGEN